jgi:DNA polymerase III epsilon subunit-like protein/GNAT superfamily N-acetyltransferase
MLTDEPILRALHERFGAPPVITTTNPGVKTLSVAHMGADENWAGVHIHMPSSGSVIVLSPEDAKGLGRDSRLGVASSTDSRRFSISLLSSLLDRRYRKPKGVTRMLVDPDPRGTYRHEYGHYVLKKLRDPYRRVDPSTSRWVSAYAEDTWEKFFEKIGRPDWAEAWEQRFVREMPPDFPATNSMYAWTNPLEMFAEGFSAYMSPNPESRAMNNDAMNRMLDTVLSVEIGGPREQHLIDPSKVPPQNLQVAARRADGLASRGSAPSRSGAPSYSTDRQIVNRRGKPKRTKRRSEMFQNTSTDEKVAYAVPTTKQEYYQMVYDAWHERVVAGHASASWGRTRRRLEDVDKLLTFDPETGKPTSRIPEIQEGLDKVWERAKLAEPDFSPEAVAMSREIFRRSLDSSPALRWAVEQHGMPPVGMASDSAMRMTIASYISHPLGHLSLRDPDASKVIIDRMRADLGPKATLFDYLKHPDFDKLFRAATGDEDGKPWFPTVGGYVNDSGGGSILLYPGSTGHRMWMDGYRMDLGHVPKPGDHNVLDKSLEGVILHEYGHYLDYYARRRASGMADGSMPQSEAFEYAFSVHGALAKIGLMDVINGKRDPNGYWTQTRYGQTSTDEMIAEAVAAVLSGNPAAIEMLSPALRDQAYWLVGVKATNAEKPGKRTYPTMPWAMSAEELQVAAMASEDVREMAQASQRVDIFLDEMAQRSPKNRRRQADSIDEGVQRLGETMRRWEKEREKQRKRQEEWERNNPGRPMPLMGDATRGKTVPPSKEEQERSAKEAVELARQAQGYLKILREHGYTDLDDLDPGETEEILEAIFRGRVSLTGDKTYDNRNIYEAQDAAAAKVMMALGYAVTIRDDKAGESKLLEESIDEFAAEIDKMTGEMADAESDLFQNWLKSYGMTIDEFRKMPKGSERKKIVDNFAASFEINLCNYYIAGTNVFCGENIGVTRVDMPQLSGRTVGKDSPAIRALLAGRIKGKFEMDKKKLGELDEGVQEIVKHLADNWSDIAETYHAGRPVKATIGGKKVTITKEHVDAFLGSVNWNDTEADVVPLFEQAARNLGITVAEAEFVDPETMLGAQNELQTRKVAQMARGVVAAVQAATEWFEEQNGRKPTRDEIMKLVSDRKQLAELRKWDVAKHGGDGKYNVFTKADGMFQATLATGKGDGQRYMLDGHHRWAGLILANKMLRDSGYDDQTVLLQIKRLETDIMTGLEVGRTIQELMGIKNAALGAETPFDRGKGEIVPIGADEYATLLKKLSPAELGKSLMELRLKKQYEKDLIAASSRPEREFLPGLLDAMTGGLSPMARSRRLGPSTPGKTVEQIERRTKPRKPRLYLDPESGDEYIIGQSGRRFVATIGGFEAASLDVFPGDDGLPKTHGVESRPGTPSGLAEELVAAASERYAGLASRGDDRVVDIKQPNVQPVGEDDILVTELPGEPGSEEHAAAFVAIAEKSRDEGRVLVFSYTKPGSPPETRRVRVTEIKKGSKATYLVASDLDRNGESRDFRIDRVGAPEVKKSPSGANVTTKQPKKPRSQPAPYAGEGQRVFDGATSWRDVVQNLGKGEFIAFDFETVGFDADPVTGEMLRTGLPVQIGLVRIRDGQIVERLNLYMNPGVPLSGWSKDNLKRYDPETGKMIQMTDEWLATQPPYADVLRQAIEFMGPNPILVAQNHPFDKMAMEQALEAAGLSDLFTPAGYLDSLGIAKLAYPEKSSRKLRGYRLGDLAEEFGYDMGDGWHSADVDAEAAWQIIVNMTNRLADAEDAGESVDRTLLNPVDVEMRMKATSAEYKRQLEALRTFEAARNKMPNAEPSLQSRGATVPQERIDGGKGLIDHLESSPRPSKKPIAGPVLMDDARSVFDGEIVGRDGRKYKIRVQQAILYHPDDSTSSISVDGGVFDESGEEVATWTRNIRYDKITNRAHAFHKSFIVADGHRGRGIATAFNNRNDDLYSTLGFGDTLVDAASSTSRARSPRRMTGVTHWARTGYDVSRNKDWNALKNALEQIVKETRDGGELLDDGPIPPKTIRRIEDIIDDMNRTGFNDPARLTAGEILRWPGADQALASVYDGLGLNIEMRKTAGSSEGFASRGGRFSRREPALFDGAPRYTNFPGSTVSPANVRWERERRHRVSLEQPEMAEQILQEYEQDIVGPWKLADKYETSNTHIRKIIQMARRNRRQKEESASVGLQSRGGISGSTKLRVIDNDDERIQKLMPMIIDEEPSPGIRARIDAVRLSDDFPSDMKAYDTLARYGRNKRRFVEYVDSNGKTTPYLLQNTSRGDKVIVYRVDALMKLIESRDGKISDYALQHPADRNNSLNSAIAGIMHASLPIGTRAAKDHYEIYGIEVKKSHRRRGLGTAMMKMHRDTFPELRLSHSSQLSEDGKNFAVATPTLSGGFQSRGNAPRKYDLDEFIDEIRENDRRGKNKKPKKATQGWRNWTSGVKPQSGTDPDDPTRLEHYAAYPVVEPQDFGWRNGDPGTPRWMPFRDAIREEVSRGNEVPDEDIVSGLAGNEAIWVTHDKREAARYSMGAEDWDSDIPDETLDSLVQEVDLRGSVPVLDDGDGGYLYVRPRKSRGLGSRGGQPGTWSGWQRTPEWIRATGDPETIRMTWNAASRRVDQAFREMDINGGSTSNIVREGLEFATAFAGASILARTANLPETDLDFMLDSGLGQLAERYGMDFAIGLVGQQLITWGSINREKMAKKAEEIRARIKKMGEMSRRATSQTRLIWGQVADMAKPNRVRKKSVRITGNPAAAWAQMSWKSWLKSRPPETTARMAPTRPIAYERMARELFESGYLGLPGTWGPAKAVALDESYREIGGGFTALQPLGATNP